LITIEFQLWNKFFQLPFGEKFSGYFYLGIAGVLLLPQAKEGENFSNTLKKSASELSPQSSLKVSGNHIYFCRLTGVG